MPDNNKANSKYIGRRVSRAFGSQGQLYQGTIDSYDQIYDLWHITYDDGDAEEMDHVELLVAMDLFEGNGDRSYIGRRVSRAFGTQICDGTVDAFDSRRRMWTIAYDYGEVGEMDHRELLYALDLFESKDELKAVGAAAGSKKAAAAKPKRRSPKRKTKRKTTTRKGDNVQLFAFDSDKPTSKVKEELGPTGRPKRKLKCTARFDPTSYNAQTHCRTGHGFPCPRCSSICSYDAQECEECYLECCYEPGVGPVVLKERKVSPKRPRKTKKLPADVEASYMKSLSELSHQLAKTPRKSVEDITDIVLAVKKEQQKNMRDDALEIE